ncbi:hypothetical protein VNI00_013001 [Paramarasmius palmivorus]|uniref:Uncharacterized protein n=1 Tax=Paramarasmius palmivorus TaxID=297713 RepID=A0AAW0BZI8_9AGAR
MQRVVYLKEKLPQKQSPAFDVPIDGHESDEEVRTDEECGHRTDDGISTDEDEDDPSPNTGSFQLAAVTIATTPDLVSSAQNSTLASPASTAAPLVAICPVTTGEYPVAEATIGMEKLRLREHGIKHPGPATSLTDASNKSPGMVHSSPADDNANTERYWASIASSHQPKCIH